MPALKLTHEDVDYVEDDDSAARLYVELQHQLAAETREGKRGSAQQTQRAINKLVGLFPDVGAHAARATSDQLGGLSPELKKTHSRVRGQHGLSATEARNARRREQRAGHEHRSTSGGTGAASPAATTPRGTRRRSSSWPAGGGRAWQQTGVPGAVASWRELALQIAGFGLLASLLYVVLTDAENPGRGWPSVVQTFVGSLGNGIRAIVAPIDPLTPHAAAPQTVTQQRAAAAAARQRDTTNDSVRLAGYPDSHGGTATGTVAPIFRNPIHLPTFGGPTP